jgi:hypothetical protein
MNSSSADHLDDDQLLRALDGEGEAEELARARAHIESCWLCRSRTQEMGQAIAKLIAWRNRQFAASEQPAAIGRERLRRALAQQPREDLEPRSLFATIGALPKSFASRRVQFMSAAVAVGVAAFITFFPLAEAPKLTAAGFLQRAQLARELPSGRRGRVYERIEVRYGARLEQREFIWRPKLRAAGENASWQQTAKWLPVVENGPVSWEDPMGVEAFEQWHDRLTRKTDTIRETSESITLRTEPAVRDRIVAASLIVRRSDWRPIGKEIEFSDLPGLELRQIGYEVRNDAEEPEEVSPPLLSARAHLRQPQEPSEISLDRAEIEVWEALHRVGADQNEFPEILRVGGVIRVRAVAETAERKDALLAALQPIPLVDPQVTDATSATTSGSVRAATTSQPVSNSRVYSTAPPLAKELWNYMRGMDAANEYLGQVRDSYFVVLPKAKALESLAERYSAAANEALPADVRSRVNQLAVEHIAKIRADADAYLRGIADPLDEMLRRSSVRPANEISKGASCRSWQSLSPVLVTDLETLQTALRRLFVVEQTDEPLVLSGEALLAQSTRARAELVEVLSELCGQRDHDPEVGGSCRPCQ